MIPYLDIAPVPNHDNENAIKLSPKKICRHICLRQMSLSIRTETVQ